VVAGRQLPLGRADLFCSTTRCSNSRSIALTSSLDHEGGEIGYALSHSYGAAFDNPDLIVARVVNVVDLMTLQPYEERPHGLTDHDFDALFTFDKPIIFAYHGYPWLIHRLTYRRTNHRNLHVRGYKEEGTATTCPKSRIGGLVPRLPGSARPPKCERLNPC
jgi:phosphoketolase